MRKPMLKREYSQTVTPTPMNESQGPHPAARPAAGPWAKNDPHAYAWFTRTPQPPGCTLQVQRNEPTKSGDREWTGSTPRN